MINANAVRSKLEELGLGQKDLAEFVGVSAQAVTNWLQGKDFPRPAKLLKLSAALRLNHDELVVKEDDSSRPVVAFRKKGAAKTTDEHVKKAEAIGGLLRPLVSYLDELYPLRVLITSPSTEYRKLQTTVTQVRERLGIGKLAELEYEHLIGEFKSSGAVLVPVLWGTKKNHKNALHIRLPKEDVTFVFVNLDTRVEDFKFWMAHELAHVYTPDLAGTDEGEDFADAFAGALLFPETLAKSAYSEAANQGAESAILEVLQGFATAHNISLNSVYQEVRKYYKEARLPALSIDEKIIHAYRNSNGGPLVSEALFKPQPPSPDLYIRDSENVFASDFFPALKRMMRERNTGPGYVQQVLDISIQDAMGLCEALGD